MVFCLFNISVVCSYRSPYISKLMWVIFWLISPHQICLHLGFWEWCMHNHLCYYHSLCLLNWLFCYCLYVCSFIQVKLSCFFSLLTVFSDHLTMSYIFHIALSNEMKMEKSIGEGQKTENWKVSVKSVLSNFLADSNFSLFPKIIVFLVTCISFFL